MCNPALALVVLSVAATAATTYGQMEAADAQNKFQKATVKEGSKIAREDFDTKIEAESRRQLEEREARSQQTQAVKTETAKARSSAEVAAGESNVGGLSIESLLADFDTQEAANLGSISRSGSFSTRQFDLSARSHRATANNYLTNLRGRPAARPNLLAAAIGGAGAAGQTYANTRGLT